MVTEMKNRVRTMTTTIRRRADETPTGLIFPICSCPRALFKNGFPMDLTILTHAIPLTAIICLVYSTSRFELPSRILRSAGMMFVKTIGFLGLLYGFLLYLSR